MAFSCDTFVALPPATKNGCIIFGKNSDRPADEVQEVVYVPAADYKTGEKIKCTYVEVNQVEHTYAVILSKPGWMWGAEMGANENGVVIGNEAVWTRLTDDLGYMKDGLLGMDYLRLGLERGSTARQAMNVITDLLKVYGQHGRCFEAEEWSTMSYCNSFIIADRSEAWVLETAGTVWAAERITSGVRNISNFLTIGTRIDAMSEGLVEYAQRKGLWGPEDGEFHFTKAFSTSPPVECLVKRPERGLPAYRFVSGKSLLENYSRNGEFDESSMMSILQNEDSGICCTEGSVSVGSQVSILWPTASNKINLHWFTATPNPSRSVFKPFTFLPDVDIGHVTKSPDYGMEDPVQKKPRFETSVDRQHSLYKAHARSRPLGSNPNLQMINQLKNFQQSLLKDVDKIIQSGSTEGCKNIFKSAAEKEIQIYMHPSNL